MWVMLSWSPKTQITDTDVAGSARGVITFDLKQAPYMLKLSAAAWKEDSYDHGRQGSLLPGLFV